MASTGSATTTTATTTTTGPGVMDTIISWLSYLTVPKIVTTISIFVAIILYVFAFTNISSYLNKSTYADNWTTIRPTIWKTIGLSAIGSFLFYIVSLLYFIQDASKTNWFLIIMSFITVFFSFLALTLSTQPRQK